MSDDLRERVARAIKNAADWPADWLLEEDELYRMADAALAEIGGGPDWEGFGRDLLESWPVGDVDGADLFDTALRHGLIREVPGGYDPEQHIDAECICPEKGDPWYEYAFGAAIEPAPVQRCACAECDCDNPPKPKKPNLVGTGVQVGLLKKNPGS